MKDSILRIEKYVDASHAFRQTFNINALHYGKGDNQNNFRADIDNNKNIVWRSLDDSLYTTEDLVSKVFAGLMEFLRQEIEDKKNR